MVVFLGDLTHELYSIVLQQWLRVIFLEPMLNFIMRSNVGHDIL